MGRKDRHSKVCTAKGPRDRRVRLAAHTAIQFYDVQDRLGYDRPSKAVDWLIKKAKSAIDDLAQEEEARRRQSQLGFRQSDLGISDPGNRAVGMIGDGDDDHRKENTDNPSPQISSFLPPSLDSEVIADTIKSFPRAAAASAANHSSALQFQNFQNPNSQDLRLSLQSIHDPIMLHRHNPPPRHQNPNPETEPLPILLSGTPLGFDASSSWPDWNSGGYGSGSTASGFLFNSPPPFLLSGGGGHNQFVTQRGPLQSSNSPSIRAWIDPSAMADHHQHQSGLMPVYPSSISAIGFSSSGFPGFHIPARIQGDEEEHDGHSDKPSSASSDSRH